MSYINLSIRTVGGSKPFGRFELGNDSVTAKDLFINLKGSTEVDPQDILFIELVEMVNGLPFNISIMSSDLQELGTNCMMITQEVFWLANLKQ